MARLDHVLSVLRTNADELRRRGVVHAGVFGSVARGEDTAESDVDIAIEIDRANPIGLFQYSAIGNYLEDLLDCEVDMAVRDGVRESLRARIDRDYKDAF